MRPIRWVYSEMLMRIWSISAPHPFIAASLVEPDESSRIGGLLYQMWRHEGLIDCVDLIRLTNRVKVYQIRREVCDWCEDRYGPASPLQADYSAAYLQSYKQTHNFDNRRVP